MPEISTLLARARKRLIRMHFEAQVGHLGGNLSCLDALVTLFHCNFTADDELILSKGHSAGALYVAMWSKGLIPDTQLRTFHSDGTNLPGHPPSSGLPGVSFGTGSLGHGLSLAAGVALARRLSKSPGKVYCLTSDGEWQEGAMWEALRFLVALQLDSVAVLVDANGWQGFGKTSELTNTNQLVVQLEAFGVAVSRVDGHDADAISRSLNLRPPVPHVLVLDTIKGRSWPGFENTLASHYLPPSEDFSQILDSGR